MSTQRVQEPFPFVHLHVHSYYTFFGSTLAPADIVAWAAGRPARALLKEGQWIEPIGDVLPLPRQRAETEPPNERDKEQQSPPAIALTDTNSMTGIVEFYEAAAQSDKARDISRNLEPECSLTVTSDDPEARKERNTAEGNPVCQWDFTREVGGGPDISESVGRPAVGAWRNYSYRSRGEV